MRNMFHVMKNQYLICGIYFSSDTLKVPHKTYFISRYANESLKIYRTIKF